MRKLLLACCVLGFIAQTGCDRPQSNPTEVPAQKAPRGAAPSRIQEAIPNSASGTIVAFGDSLTAGYGIAPEQAYPAVLERRLNKLGYSYRVVNAGVSGDTTAGGLRRVDWILRSDPQIVILELGANDGLRGQDLDKTRENLGRIIEKLLENGVAVILAGMKIPPNYGPDYTRKFSEIFYDLARQYDLAFVPLFLDGVAAKRHLNQPDGIHPTPEGYERVVDNILPVLLPLLPAHSSSERKDFPGG